MMKCIHAECFYAECGFAVFKLNVVMLSVQAYCCHTECFIWLLDFILLFFSIRIQTVIMLSADLLSVVAPL